MPWVFVCHVWADLYFDNFVISIIFLSCIVCGVAVSQGVERDS